MYTENLFTVMFTIICHAISLALITTPRFSKRKTILIWVMSITSSLIIIFVILQFFSKKVFLGGAFLSTWSLCFGTFLYLSKDRIGKNIFILVTYTDFFFFVAAIPVFVYPNSIALQFMLRLVFYVVFWIVYAKFGRELFNEVTEDIEKGWGAINTMAILFFLYLFYNAIYPHVVYDYELTDLLRLGFIGIMIIGSNTVVFKTISYMHQVSEIEQFLSKEKYLSSQIEMLKESEEHMKRIRHDIRHHNLHIAQYAKNNDVEGLLHYLGQYQEEEDKQYVKKICENDIVNSILLVYTQKALEHAIDIKTEALLDNSINIKESDFVSILGNILENCIHGCLLYDGLDRYININIYTKANKVVIICKNSSQNDIAFINGIPQSKVSTGIGVKSIIHTISKYDGDYEFSVDNHVFTTRILLNVN